MRFFVFVKGCVFCVSLPDLDLLVLSCILELPDLWTLFSQTLTLFLSHLLPGFAASFSLTSRSVFILIRVFIMVLYIRLKLRSQRRLHVKLHDPQNKRSEIWSILCRRMGWKEMCLEEICT